MQTSDNAWLKVKDIQNSVYEIISRCQSWYITKQLLIAVIFCTFFVLSHVLSYQQEVLYFQEIHCGLNATQGVCQYLAFL